MGRHSLRATRVLAAADLALASKRITHPPPWYQVISDYPPPPRLTRPVLSQSQKKAFKPQQIKYPEDEFRTEFYSDHPWELARPKVVLEEGGNDHKNFDWSRLDQPGKRLDGESVVRRQQHLIHSQNLSKQHAYDLARREFYTHRHREDVERQMAREEALATGAYFNKGTNEIAERLEDAAFDRWKVWAKERSDAFKQRSAAGYSGVDEEAAEASTVDELAVIEEEEAPGVEEVGTGRDIVADAVGEDAQPYRMR